MKYTRSPVLRYLFANTSLLSKPLGLHQAAYLSKSEIIKLLYFVACDNLPNQQKLAHELTKCV